ncbi:tRNA adenilyl transferase [Tieghemostelium lacteum]|uniref:tRNA adenilyl transferase n=1 Tax=Tieghemostelium lacteum TaxID=361077 RepID=A0A151Z7S9_TIELA|nr:tRNA adenilyl transferase [Tieghemostelium lacteum]|eukprot:KYQ90023.1 tRNA adenilyl transferase [Tieghemostelium lacteum]
MIKHSFKLLCKHIIITPNEQKLFQKLKNATVDRDDVTIRIAGGWVRNKLLAMKSEQKEWSIDEENKDIDIALDNINGSDFVNSIINIEKEPLRSYTVKLNPEKSKHLETASIVIDGYNIDCNGLRSDIYSQDSRIPLITKGTPLSDALRRDITINTLFYNIHTQEIEDHTQQGLKDLSECLIRTPLSPFETLLEDPLRAFRVLRFATKFHFAIEPQLMGVIKSVDFRKTVLKKVSRERINTEFNKLMTKPAYALQYFKYLVETGLVEIVYHHTPNPSLPFQNSLPYLELGNSQSVNTKVLDTLEFRHSLIFYPMVLDNLLSLTDITKILRDFKSPNKEISQTLSILRLSQVLSTIKSHYTQDTQHTNTSIESYLIDSPTNFKTHLFPLLLELRKSHQFLLSIHLCRIHSQINDNNNNNNSEQFWNDVEALISIKCYPLSKIKYSLTQEDVFENVEIVKSGKCSGTGFTSLMNELIYHQFSKHNFKSNHIQPISKQEAIQFLNSLPNK